MIEDMRMRKLAEHTQDGYIRAVRKLAAFLGARRTPPRSRISGAFNCIWWTPAPRR